MEHLDSTNAFWILRKKLHMWRGRTGLRKVRVPGVLLETVEDINYQPFEDLTAFPCLNMENAEGVT